MLIGVIEAAIAIAARAMATDTPPTTTGTPAATKLPKTTRSAIAASGSEITSLRRRSPSETTWMSP